MPSLADSRRQLDPAQYQRVETPLAISPHGTPSLEPIFNSFLRCPLPPVAVTPDSLRQFYRAYLVPQSRIMTPTTLSASPTGTTITRATVSPGVSITTGTGSGTGTGTGTGHVVGGTGTTLGTVTNASFTTPVLDQGQTFFATLTMAKTFDLLQVTTSAAARIRVYATASEQQQDVGRGSDTALPAGTEQGIIADVTLDTTPMLWEFTPIPIGSNGDNPRSPSMYITVDNITASSTSIIVSILYLPTE